MTKRRLWIEENQAIFSIRDFVLEVELQRLLDLRKMQGQIEGSILYSDREMEVKSLKVCNKLAFSEAKEMWINSIWITARTSKPSRTWKNRELNPNKSPKGQESYQPFWKKERKLREFLPERKD